MVQHAESECTHSSYLFMSNELNYLQRNFEFLRLSLSRYHSPIRSPRTFTICLFTFIHTNTHAFFVHLICLCRCISVNEIAFNNNEKMRSRFMRQIRKRHSVTTIWWRVRCFAHLVNDNSVSLFHYRIAAHALKCINMFVWSLINDVVAVFISFHRIRTAFLLDVRCHSIQ